MEHTFVRLATIATLAAAFSQSLWSAEPAPQAEQTERERAHCLSGKSQQDEATCLREVLAARQESRQKGLDTPADSQLSIHAVERCRAQPARDRADCVNRIMDTGASDGSVKGGGIIYRRETVSP